MAWRDSVILRCANVLSRGDQLKVGAVILLQVGLGILDLVGVALIGLLGALAVTGIASTQPGNRVSAALNFLNLSDSSLQVQAATLGVLAVAFLVGRTLISVFFTRRTLFFLSRRAASVSADLMSRLLSQSLLTVQTRSTQETLFSVTYGVSAITVGILGTTVSLISDVSLLLVMTIGLFVIDPIVAMGSLFVFATIGFVLFQLLHSKAENFGQKETELNIASSEKIIEVLSSYRESVVRGRREYYAREIRNLRMSLADTEANLAFMPSISKYVIEASVVIGSLLIGATQFLTQDASHAVATITVFLAAGTRIGPAVLRVQQGAVTIRGKFGAAAPTLILVESLSGTKKLSEVADTVETKHEGFYPSVEVSNISFKYPGQESEALLDFSIFIPSGAFVAVVGPSGAGKTTFIDVLLGVIQPDSGQVKISGLNPLESIKKYPGAIAYVPQDVIITNGTVRENVALGYPKSSATDKLVFDAIKVAHLDSFISDLQFGLETQVGERGTKISGGQRQRIGISRAMFTKPLLLVLDEATSSLDGETESTISEAILHLRGSTTVITIAHRLSTVRNADLVIYMDNGKLIAKGTFSDVRNAVPDFDRQATVMGL
jgi:ABC-type multidrug transport system fused ATPase/permease subunit